MTSGLTGIVHASFEMVRRLEDAGHDVVYACPQDVRVKVEAQGIAYEQLPPVDFSPCPPLPQITGPARELRKIVHGLRAIRERRRVGIDRLNLKAFEELLETRRPDLLLIDMEMHDHIITAVARGTPVLLVNQFFCSWRRPGLPPIDSAIIPGVGFEGSAAGLAWVWTRRRLGGWSKRWWQSARAGFVDRRLVLKAYARQVGFPLELLEEGNWPPPFTYRDMPVISLASQALEFEHDPRPGLHYVGPMASLDRVEGDANPGMTEDIDHIVAGSLRQSESLIVCSVTTMDADHVDLTFVRRLMDAVARQPTWRLVVGLGGHTATEDLGTLPDNVHVFPWIPQTQLLKKAALSISHGGVHTLNECLELGVPMLIYSGDRFDQRGCAARVSAAGFGHLGDRRHDDAETIARRIESIMDDDDLHARLRAASTRSREPSQRDALTRIVNHYLAEQ
jgi:hypothetical protein